MGTSVLYLRNKCHQFWEGREMTAELTTFYATVESQRIKELWTMGNKHSLCGSSSSISTVFTQAELILHCGLLKSSLHLHPQHSTAQHSTAQQTDMILDNSSAEMCVCMHEQTAATDRNHMEERQTGRMPSSPGSTSPCFNKKYYHWQMDQSIYVYLEVPPSSPLKCFLLLFVCFLFCVIIEWWFWFMRALCTEKKNH